MEDAWRELRLGLEFCLVKKLADMMMVMVAATASWKKVQLIVKLPAELASASPKVKASYPTDQSLKAPTEVASMLLTFFMLLDEYVL